MRKFCQCVERCCHKFRLHPWLNTLYIVLCVLSVVSLGFLIRSLIVNPGSKCTCVWQNWEFWSGTLYGCLTLWVISYNLMKFSDVEAIKALSDLRFKLHEKENREIHKLLLASDEDDGSIVRQIRQRKHRSSKDCQSTSKNCKTDDCDGKKDPQSEVEDMDLFNYLGTIELGSIMLQKGIVSFDEFFNQFGYRVQNIVCCDEVIHHVMSDANKSYYKNLIYVIKEFHRQELI